MAAAVDSAEQSHSLYSGTTDVSIPVDTKHTERLSVEWCNNNVDEELQKYMGEPPPDGLGVIYVYIQKSGKKRCYAGQTVDFPARHYIHCNNLRWPETPDRRHTLIDKKIYEYGANDFHVFILHLAPKELLDDLEVDTISRFQLFPPKLGFGYNCTPGGGATWSCTPEARAKLSEMKKAYWASMTDQEKQDSYVHLQTASARKKRGIAVSNAAMRKTKEQRSAIAKKTVAARAPKDAQRLLNLKKSMATPESKAKRSIIATEQQKRERAEELEIARKIAVPFVQSKKKRAEMRANSTAKGKKDNNVLFMISADGKSICRVDKHGTFRDRDIVGPVVDS